MPHPSFLSIRFLPNSETEIEGALLLSLMKDPQLKKLVPEQKCSEVDKVVRVLQLELSQIDSSFAVRGADRRDYLIRGAKISAAVDHARGQVEAEMGGEDWQSLKAQIVASKIRNIGIEYLVRNHSKEELETAEEELNRWLNQVDEAYNAIDIELLSEILEILTKQQRDRIANLLGKRPVWQVNGISQSRLNLSFKFYER